MHTQPEEEEEEEEFVELGAQLAALHNKGALKQALAIAKREVPANTYRAGGHTPPLCETLH